MRKITVVGGGLTGLVASIVAAENGASVDLFEAQRRLGGRARSTKPPYVANFGGHVMYGDGPWWAWLRERRIVPLHAGYPMGGLRFHVNGRLRAVPPAETFKALFKLRNAPVEQSFRTWATSKVGARIAEQLSAAAVVFSFDHDPGRLSAEFVWSRLQRVVRGGRSVKYIRGGWVGLVSALESHARTLGVTIHMGVPVSTLPDSPVILAVPLKAARQILEDPTLEWESGRAALLDLALRKRRGDPFIVWSLDEHGWIERYTKPDPSLAPEGISLIQAHTGLHPGEEPGRGIARIEQLMDVAFADWRDRVEWRRNDVSERQTGALDLPGTTWSDRPGLDRRDGVFLAGDEVAAPGLLSEVGLSSAIRAAEAACAWLYERPVSGSGHETPNSRADA